MSSTLISEAAGVTSDWRWVLLRRFQKILVLKLSPVAISDLATNFNNRFGLPQPLSLTDLEKIGVRTKHMNLVSFAQGFLYMKKGLLARSSDSRACIRLLQQAIAKFEVRTPTNHPHPFLVPWPIAQY